MQTKEQKRSLFALEQISRHFNDQVDQETANFIVGMPTMILTNGLGQSMAFLLSKGERQSKYGRVFDIISTWLQQDIQELAAPSEMEFLKQFSRLDQSVYLTAQQETLAVLQWLKRYARAFQQ